MRKYKAMIRDFIQSVFFKRLQPCKVTSRSINPGCLACGNPTYPECTTHCPMFDD